MKISVNRLLAVLGLVYFAFFFYLMLVGTDATARLSLIMVIVGAGVSFGWFVQGLAVRRSIARSESMLIREVKALEQKQKDQFEKVRKLQERSSLQTSRFIKNQTDILYRRIEALNAVNAEIATKSSLPSMSGWALFPDSALLLIDVVKEAKPKVVLDLGSGVSTILCGHLIKGYGGKVYSIDHDESYLKETQKTVKRHGLSSVVELIHAPLKARKIKRAPYKWYDFNLAEIGVIDLLIVDGPPGGTQKHARYPALPEVYGKLSRDAVVVVDDFHRQDEQWMVSEWRKQFKDFDLQSVETEKGVGILRRKS